MVDLRNLEGVRSAALIRSGRRLRNVNVSTAYFSRSSLARLKRFNASTVHFREAMTRRHFLRYSSLLGQCLRLTSYATGALPNLRLRAFHRRSSLPSLCYRVAANSVAAHETPAPNDYGRDGVKRSRLLDLLSLTKRR